MAPAALRVFSILSRPAWAETRGNWLNLRGLSHLAIPAYARDGLLRDVLAGLVASIVLVANIVSFAALIFPGALAGGASTAIWAMLIGSGFSGLWIARRRALAEGGLGFGQPSLHAGAGQGKTHVDQPLRGGTHAGHPGGQLSQA